MEPKLGSILQFTPVAPGWTAVVSNEDKAWQEPVIGWAVVVIWTAYDGENEDQETKGTKQYQTEVQPMLLTEDGQIEVPMMREGLELQHLCMPGQVVLSE